MESRNLASFSLFLYGTRRQRVILYEWATLAPLPALFFSFQFPFLTSSLPMPHSSTHKTIVYLFANDLGKLVNDSLKNEETVRKVITRLLQTPYKHT